MLSLSKHCRSTVEGNANKKRIYVTTQLWCRGSASAPRLGGSAARIPGKIENPGIQAGLSTIFRPCRAVSPDSEPPGRQSRQDPVPRQSLGTRPNSVKFKKRKDSGAEAPPRHPLCRRYWRQSRQACPEPGEGTGYPGGAWIPDLSSYEFIQLWCRGSASAPRLGGSAARIPGKIENPGIQAGLSTIFRPCRAVSPDSEPPGRQSRQDSVPRQSLGTRPNLAEFLGQSCR